MKSLILAFGVGLVGVTALVSSAAEFKVGTAKRDITPQGATPMWGYGARHALLSQGTLDPLMAKAVVIEAGDMVDNSF